MKIKNNKFKVQVSNDHYNNKYDNVGRFISYFYQIDLVQKLKPNNVLEIGIGNKTTSNYLKENGIVIDTCDFDKRLSPDYVADIRNLPFKDKSYDVVLACEILEHLPWKDVDIALNELYRVSKKYVIISIPYSSLVFEVVFKFPIINKIFHKSFLSLFFRIPFFFRRIEFSGEHYWEMGRKNYSKREIKRIFNKYFKIKKEISPILNKQHYFFIMQKL